VANKIKEIQKYVDKVSSYEREFAKNSKADKATKTDKPKKIKKLLEGGHWATVDGHSVFIEDK